jgi:hypothetical protein
MTTTGHFAGIDFAVGLVRGVRSWDVTDDGMLLGVVYHQLWTPDVNQALCRRREPIAQGYPLGAAGMLIVPAKPPIPPEEYVPPVPRHMFDCQCGFYAYYDGSNDYYRGDYAVHRRVTGVVEGWGEVAVGTRGFRCTKARVVAIYLSDMFTGNVDQLRANYPDVAYFDTFTEMISEFPEEDGGARAQWRRDEEERVRQEMERERLALERAQKAALFVMDDDGGTPTS